MFMKQRRQIACLVLAFATVGGLSEAAAENHGGQAGTIVVRNTADLLGALVPANAGRHILVQSGTYEVASPLTVPNGATLEGEGVMQGGTLPTGFQSGTETRIVAAAGFSGDLLTLGGGATLRRLLVQYSAGSAGNAVGVVSSGPNTSLSASIQDSEIVNPNPAMGNADGPTGGGVVVLTRNPGADAGAPPHVGASVALELTRSIVRVPGGAGRALFAINSASHGTIDLTLTGNVVFGTLDAVGGVSRGDEVTDASITIRSRENRYTSTGNVGVAWSIVGGSSPPLFLGKAGTSSNHVLVDSTDDRIEDVDKGILSLGGRRHSKRVGLSSDNEVELSLRGLSFRTNAADFHLAGAESGGEFPTGAGNTLSVLVRGSTGSGPRGNFYAHEDGPLMPKNLGFANRLVFLGTAAVFDESNDDIAPAPPADMFGG